MVRYCVHLVPSLYPYVNIEYYNDILSRKDVIKWYKDCILGDFFIVKKENIILINCFEFSYEENLSGDSNFREQYFQIALDKLKKLNKEILFAFLYNDNNLSNIQYNVSLGTINDVSIEKIKQKMEINNLSYEFIQELKCFQI